jgi:hypothetical protein
MKFNSIVFLCGYYHWQRTKLEKNKQWDLSTKSSLRELRERLASYIRSSLKGEFTRNV